MAQRPRDKNGRFVKSPPEQRDFYAGQSYSGGGWYSLPKQSHAGIQVDELTALNLSSIWRGVNVLAGDVAKLPLNVYQRLDGGGKRVVRDNPLFELLSYPNRYQAGRRFFHTVMVHTVLSAT